MGRQDGIAPIKGKVGTFSFYKSSEDGYLARKKGGVDSQRIKTDPAYERVRQHGAEFGRAGKASKLLRDALRTLLINTADKRVTSRLTKKMLEVVKSDPVNDRGLRTADKGNLTGLIGFEFNGNMPLTSKLLMQQNTVIDRVAGTLQVALPDFVPSTHVRAPIGTTHFRILVAGVEPDFAQERYSMKMAATDPIATREGAITHPTLSVALTPGSTKPLVLALGIEFGDYFKGEFHAFKDSSHNALRIVDVNMPA